MSYLQVLTDGSQIVLTVGEKNYYYHTSGTRKFIYCEDATQLPPSESTTPSLDK
jgi:hypothetical protein